MIGNFNALAEAISCIHTMEAFRYGSEADSCTGRPTCLLAAPKRPPHPAVTPACAGMTTRGRGGGGGEAERCCFLHSIVVYFPTPICANFDAHGGDERGSKKAKKGAKKAKIFAIHKYLFFEIVE